MKNDDIFSLPSPPAWMAGPPLGGDLPDHIPGLPDGPFIGTPLGLPPVPPPLDVPGSAPDLPPPAARAPISQPRLSGIFGVPTSPPTHASQEDDAPVQEFIMGWYGRPIARMRYSGVEFGFDYETGWCLPLEAYNRAAGQCPMFLRSFLPSSIASRNVDAELGKAMAEYFIKQERFLGNVSVVSDVNRLRDILPDCLEGRLHRFATPEGIFTGDQSGIGLMTRSMITNITQISAERNLTQISGAQTKIPMYLNRKGELNLASDGLPATHIVKYAGFGSDPDHTRGAAEWIGMHLASAGGVFCAQFALIEMESERGLSLNYLTERFDLPNDEDDPRLIFCEELGAAFGLRPGQSDIVDLNTVINGVARLSTHKDKDLEQLLRQVTANCLLENGDFHVRNMSLLKVAEPTLDKFRSVRLSPAYDVMRTRDFAKVPIARNAREGMRLALEIDGDLIDFDSPTVEQFLQVGRLMGFADTRTEEILHDVALGMAKKAIAMNGTLPEPFDRHDPARLHVLEVCDVVTKNALDLVPGIGEHLKPPGGSARGLGL